MTTITPDISTSPIITPDALGTTILDKLTYAVGKDVAHAHDRRIRIADHQLVRQIRARPLHAMAVVQPHHLGRRIDRRPRRQPRSGP